MQCLNDPARFDSRIEPVRIEADEAEAHRRLAEGIGETAAVRIAENEIVNRAGDVEIGVRVQAVDEGDPLVPKIGIAQIRRAPGRGEVCKYGWPPVDAEC